MNFRFVGWAAENWMGQTNSVDEIVTEESERNSNCVLENIENVLEDPDQNPSKIPTDIISININANPLYRSVLCMNYKYRVANHLVDNNI